MPEINLQLAKNIIQPRPKDSYKGKFGRVLIIGGNQNFGGAAIMSASAAVYAGAGLVTTATDPNNFTALHSRLPESMVLDYNDHAYLKQLVNEMNVVVIGPGLGTDGQSLAILRAVFTAITDTQAIIIDGSALTLMAQHQIPIPAKGHIVLTPHQMEWQRLSTIPINEQTDTTTHQALVKLWRFNPTVTLVLKSAQTKVYPPDGTVWINQAGNPGMATGGSGDTLTGILAACLGQFQPQDKALLAGVYLHSAVADKLAQTSYVTLPQEIIQELPKFMHQLAQA
ncbi:NAD(P)H-hydrate dehydratase [Agrilactobacillus yilanensis]|uniref:ADP-dependent (S)-NAD(P)H-hydrate dehydratase n=1 Tax=Agrilactobacillus yilanensis TaxID=2485997 RepID=A0ABW4J6C6_9LACO|nr:NAD(P)H-hydrate dehydratase [Agrilactobacillus yilanensis]